MRRLTARSRLAGLLLAGLAAALALPALLSGCGEKIAIPEPLGVWANLAYSLSDTFREEGVLQLTTGWGNLFVLSSTALTKRNLEFVPDATVFLTGDPTALCVDRTGGLILVWEQATSTLSIFDSTQLEPRGSAFLPEVQSVVSMATSPAGMGSAIVGGRTFLYLSNPAAGLIHRYAVMGAQDATFTCSDCLLPTGVLAWPEGGGARSVHAPSGLARDLADSLLVCEEDPERNWVIRFSSVPDSLDTTPVAPDNFPAWAGRAVVFGEATCEPAAAADYVLGNAALCNQSDWTGGPSDQDGEFDGPRALAIDGEGKIFVADYNNSRVQIFSRTGQYKAQFKIKGDFNRPYSLGLVDDIKGAGLVHYAAYVYVLVEGSDLVVRYISEEHYLDEFGELPPYEE